MNFNLYSSNKLEDLAAIFRRMIFDRPGPDPFVPETVVVQTQGMATWLEQEMARDGSIMANFDMPFLQSFILKTMRQLLPREELEAFNRECRIFSPEVAAWRIFRLLGESAGRWPELDRYLTGSEPVRKRRQLAGRIADLFDQYQVYRGDLLEAWRRGEEPGRYVWQQQLYREIAKGFTGPYGWFRKFFERVPERDLWSRVPVRISVFGVGTMPPLYLNFLRHLSAITEVNLFYLNPCREFWDTYEKRFRDRLADKNSGVFESTDVENPLLTSLGAQGRSFFAQTLELPELARVRSAELFRSFVPEKSESLAYPGATMLQTIQEDILRMRRRGPDGDDVEVGRTRKIDYRRDRSIRVHSCHTIRRELEVLKDELIRLFDESNGAVQPRDVIVMAPDINAYEPYIRAVFNDETFEGRYGISDRSLRQESLIAETFLQLLRQASGRFEASEILSLLDTPALRQKFRIADAEMETLRELVGQSAIRWGYDAAARRRFCDFEFGEFSWRCGFDRLLLGFAMTAPEDQLVNGEYLPCGNAEGSDAELLGRFVSFVSSLAELGERTGNAHSAEAWAQLFHNAVDTFFRPDKESLPEITALRGTIDAFAAAARDGNCDEPLPLEAVTDQLSDSFSLVQNNMPFLRGGITFCSMVPLRSIPMQAVALLGLNEGEFPRRDIRLGFNIMSDRRLGDRSRQMEDRYLFLEALLAARRTLMLFYHGSDPLTLEERPPAVPLADLIDVLKASFRDFEVIRHSLQSFNFRYFDPANGAELRCYSPEYFRAARSLHGYLAGGAEPESRLPFTLRPEPLPPVLELAELERAFLNHPEYFLRNRVGLSFRTDRCTPEDKEPFTLDGLGSYQVRDRLLDWKLSSDEGPSGELAYRLMLAGGQLPLGSAGKNEFETARRQVAALTPEQYALLTERHAEPFAVETNGITVTGSMFLSPDGTTQLFVHGSGSSPKHLLRLRLRHLLLTVRNAGNIPARSLGFFIKDSVEVVELPEFEPDVAEAELGRLLELFRDGLSRPLPLAAYFSSACSAKDEPEAKRRAALAKFDPGPFDFPLDNLEGFHRCFRPEDFNDEAFLELVFRCADLIYPKQPQEVQQ